MARWVGREFEGWSWVRTVGTGDLFSLLVLYRERVYGDGVVVGWAVIRSVFRGVRSAGKVFRCFGSFDSIFYCFWGSGVGYYGIFLKWEDRMLFIVLVFRVSGKFIGVV